MRVEDQILEHLGVNKTFPRDVGFSQKRRFKEPFRQKAYSQKEYLSKIMERRFSSDCYVALYADSMWENNVVDKNFHDIDSNDLKISYDHAIKLYNFYVETFDVEPRLYFSGSKGFHVIVDFPEVVVSPEAQLFYNFLVSYATKTRFDIGISGDRRRVSRVPYTHNISGYARRGKILMCVPVSPRWSLHKILQAAKPFESKPLGEEIQINPCKEISKILFKLEKDISPQESIMFVEMNLDPSKRVEVLNYLVKKYKEMKEPDGRHRIIHFVIVPSLVELGWSDEEIVGFCKDFITLTGASFTHYYNYTLRSIERTRKGPLGDYSRPWKPWKLDTLKSYYSDLREYL